MKESLAFSGVSALRGVTTLKTAIAQVSSMYRKVVEQRKGGTNMRLSSIVLVILAIAVLAGSALAQQPPVFRYYRLPEPCDTSASLAHAVSIGDSGVVVVGGEARLESGMTAYIAEAYLPSILQTGTARATALLCRDMLPPAPEYDTSCVNCVLRLPHTTIAAGTAGSWRGTNYQPRIPVLWHDSRANDSLDYDCVLLPVRFPGGSGVPLGLDAFVNPDGLSAVWLVGGTWEAQAWRADAIQGPYTIEVIDCSPWKTEWRPWATDVIALGPDSVVAVCNAGGGKPMPPYCGFFGTCNLRDNQGAWETIVLPYCSYCPRVNSLDMEAGAGIMAAAGTSIWTKASVASPWTCAYLNVPGGYVYREALDVGIKVNGAAPDNCFQTYVVGTCVGDQASVATLWMRDSNGAITVYDLNSLVVNVEALDLSLTSAAAIDVGGPESRIVIAGWGMEMAGGSTFTSPRDTFPHWFLLVEDLPIEAVVDVHPDVLNPRSRGRWLTCYIELPEGYDLADIDVSTVLLNETVPADEDPTEVGDHDGDGIPDLMVKFSRSEVIGVLPHGRGEVEVRVSGEVAGLRFEGIDAIRVLDERHDGGGGTVHDDSDGALTSDSRAGLPGSGDVPNTFALRQCSPNPFSVSTVIGFDLPHATSVSIRVYDTEGRAVTTLTEGLWPSGRHSASWDGADEAGKRVSPGIYFVHMKSGEYKATSKLLMVR